MQVPSRKWIVRTVTAVGGLLTTWATTGTWDTEETVFAITVVVGAFNSYVIPNETENPA